MEVARVGWVSNRAVMYLPVNAAHRKIQTELAIPGKKQQWRYYRKRNMWLSFQMTADEENNALSAKLFPCFVIGKNGFSICNGAADTCLGFFGFNLPSRLSKWVAPLLFNTGVLLIAIAITVANTSEFWLLTCTYLVWHMFVVLAALFFYFVLAKCHEYCLVKIILPIMNYLE